MAQQINHVVIGGRLTRDPELKALPSGTSVCTLRIANTRRTKREGVWEDRPGFFDVTVWGRQAENAAQYLSKGREVIVRGELRWREWEAQDGSKRQAVDINAAELQWIWDERDSGRRSPESDVPAEAPAAGAASYGGFGDGEQGDDAIPF